MIKSYKSKAAIAINVVLRNKKSIHIPFTVQSDGSSVYVTGDKQIQYALEHHYRYGKLFKLMESEDRPSMDAQKEKPEQAAGKAEDSPRTVAVSDLAAAKDFLADTFGISRTSLRSEKAIREAAKEHGIEFEGF